MATAWIEKIWNLSDHSFTLMQNDPTWRPYVREWNHSYGSDEPLTINPGDVLTCEHFFIPWIDWGRVRIEGPDGSLEVSIGPKSHSSNDFIRGFDDSRDEVLATEIGPRGGWWSASVSFHLVFHNDSFNWSIWSATRVGQDVLEKTGAYLDLAAKKLIEALVSKVAPKLNTRAMERVAGRMNSPSNPR